MQCGTSAIAVVEQVEQRFRARSVRVNWVNFGRILDLR